MSEVVGNTHRERTLQDGWVHTNVEMNARTRKWPSANIVKVHSKGATDMYANITINTIAGNAREQHNGDIEITATTSPGLM